MKTDISSKCSKYIITKHDTIKFINYCADIEVKVIIVLMFYTGLRLSEISQLKLADVSLENNILKIVKSKKYSLRNYTIKVKIDDTHSNLLLNHIARLVNQDYKLILTIDRGKGHLVYNKINNKIKNAFFESISNKDVTAHSFRASVMANMLRSSLETFSNSTDIVC